MEETLDMESTGRMAPRVAEHEVGGHSFHQPSHLEMDTEGEEAPLRCFPRCHISGRTLGYPRQSYISE